MSALNLSSVSPNELNNLFDSVDTVLLDNDGVLSHVGVFLPGVINFINYLRDSGKCVRVISNNTLFGKEYLSEIFNQQGITCKPNDFITPTCAIVQYLKDINFKGKLWPIASSNMIKQIKEAGFEIDESENGNYVSPHELKKYLFNINPDIKAILVDTDVNTTYGCIVKTIRYLDNNPDILLIFGCTDIRLPLGKSDTIFGPETFQSIIEKESHQKGIVLGKPSEGFGDYLIKSLKCEPKRTLVIGDSLYQDISFAKQMGFKQILVLTGITTKEQLLICSDKYKPDYYVNSVQELYTLLKQ